MKSKWSRRRFLEFIGSTTTVLATTSACTKTETSNTSDEGTATREGLPLDSMDDALLLAPGVKHEILLKEGTPIGKDIFFGTNNDYLNLYEFSDGRFGLWANHESLTPYLLHGRTKSMALDEKMLKHERDQVGGSFVEVKQNQSGQWEIVQDSKLNFRLSGNTPIPLSEKVGTSTEALGTLANCSGGYTPWGTILTCEENYAHFYGEVSFSSSGKRSVKNDKRDFGWSKLDPQPPENYGWVVEIDPKTKTAEKLVTLGRFSHECATVGLAESGLPVVYSGDDSEDKCLYKFIGSKRNSLKEGTLYVANLKAGKWVSLDRESNEKLKQSFKNQTEVYVSARKAAEIVGGTPLDRPEDIEIDPVNGAVLITLTNNKRKGNLHGSILKIEEPSRDSLTFKHSTFRAGGTKSGFSCPDNMAFDRKGNLWITSDISGSALGTLPYRKFGGNGLFVVPRRGKDAGKVIKVASAPHDAELTGPFFSPDEKTLFLSVQHPGERSRKAGKYTSNWPDGGNSKPLSSVVTLTGSFIEHMTTKT